MPADRTDLERRLAATTRDDTSRGLNYATLFALVRDLRGDAAARRVDVLGTGHRVDFFNYPVEQYLRCAWNVIDELEPVLGGADQVLAELGRRTVTAFFSSMLGRTALAMAGRDPRRLVGSAPSAYRGAVSYGERRVAWSGDRAAVLTFERDFMPPAFHAAVLDTALSATDARDPVVDFEEVGFLTTRYQVRWQDEVAWTPARDLLARPARPQASGAGSTSSSRRQAPLLNRSQTTSASSAR